MVMFDRFLVCLPGRVTAGDIMIVVEICTSYHTYPLSTWLMVYLPLWKKCQLG